MKRLSRLAPAMAFALTTGGCLLEPATPVEAPEGPAPVAEPVVERQLTVAPEEAPAVPPPGALPRVVVRDPVPFRMGAGYGALADVDMDCCSDRGLPPGYLHLHATFNRIGTVVRASVETPREPPASALDCIADGLRQPGVPAFDGSDVRLAVG